MLMGAFAKPMRMTVAILLLACASTVPALAALGETHESIQHDAEMLKGKVATRQMSGYSVAEITRGDGSVLREFESPEGQIFGVAWRGFTMPNLTQILGPYADEFHKAIPTDHPHHGPLSVHVGKLVVETGGHMRAFRVRAYRLDLLPSGVNEDVIQ